MIQLIFGSPGTGKTHHLVNEVIPSLTGTVCILSYTKEAAKEIASRAKVRPSFCGTIHAFAFKAMRLSRSEVLADIGEWVKSLGGNPVNAEIISFHLKHREMMVPCPSNPAYQAVIKSYKKYKEENFLYDFTDILEKGAQLPNIPEYDNIIIDEGQDLTPLQWEMVLSIPHKNLIVAGDDDQAIFEWMGADALRMLQIHGKKTILSKSYRLPSPILNYSIEMIESQVIKRQRKEVLPSDGEGKITRIPDVFHLIHTHKDPKKKITILVRDNYMKHDLTEYCYRNMIGTKNMFSGRRWRNFLDNRKISAGDKFFYKKTKEWTFDIRTIHSSKGLEWDNVCVVATMAGKVLDSLYYQKTKEAEARNWYVAITRAKKNLILAGTNEFIK
jgi:superfamily I DNA/RNA helicase